MSQWQSEHHFGRAYNWKQKHPDWYAQLNEDDKKDFEQQIKQYFEVLDNDDTYHLKRTQAQTSLTGINRKAVYMFNAKNEDGLSSLIGNLEKLLASKQQQHENLEQLILLCKGYLALLQGHNQQALNAFNQLDEQHLSEDELVQISVLEIELQHYDNAEKSLKKLAALTPSYQLQYATILRLNNKVGEAEQVYLDYLNVNNHDIAAWLALANLYLNNEANAQAYEAFSQVKQLDPENLEAQQFFDSQQQ